MSRLIIIVFALSLVGCSKSKCWKSYGEETTETRSLDFFTNLDVSGHLNVVLRNDSMHSVVLEGGSNMLPHIITEVNSGTLEIRDDNSCDFLREYGRLPTLYISAPYISSITCESTGDISCSDTLRAETFKFDQWSASGRNELILDCETAFLKLHTGTGDLTCFGNAGKVYLYSAAYGFMNTEKLITSDAWCSMQGTGDVTLFSDSTLEAFIQGPADIYYIGSPQDIRLTDDGDGELISID